MKFVSYNVQYGIGMDGAFDLERIAASIEGADVIALQEITRGFHKNGYTDMVGRFAELFPDYFFAYGAPCDVLLNVVVEDGKRIENRFQFGNMILSRWPILAVRHLLLPRSRTIEKLNLQRGALEAVIDAPDGPFRTYSVHLDHISPDERLDQIAFLKRRALDFIAEGGAITGGAAQGFPQAPLTEDFVMMGDFNMEPESPEYLAMVGRPDRHSGRALRVNQAVDVLNWAGKLTPESYSWQKPPVEGDESEPERMHLDYCFMNAGMARRVTDAFVDLEALGSDHFPVWVEVD